MSKRTQSASERAVCEDRHGLSRKAFRIMQESRSTVEWSCMHIAGGYVGCRTSGVGVGRRVGAVCRAQTELPGCSQTLPVLQLVARSSTRAGWRSVAAAARRDKHCHPCASSRLWAASGASFQILAPPQGESWRESDRTPRRGSGWAPAARPAWLTSGRFRAPKPTRPAGLGANLDRPRPFGRRETDATNLRVHHDAP